MPEFIYNIILPDLAGDINEIGKEINRELPDGLQSALRDVMFEGRPSGKFYTFAGKVYQASAAGQPPAIRSGKLIESIDGKNTGDLTSSFEMENYGGLLDEGTKKMAARPFIDLAVERFLQDAQ